MKDSVALKVHAHCCAATTPSNHRTLHLAKLKLYLLNNNFPLPSRSPGNHPSAFCLYKCACSGTSQERTHTGSVPCHCASRLSGLSGAPPSRGGVGFRWAVAPLFALCRGGTLELLPRPVAVRDATGFPCLWLSTREHSQQAGGALRSCRLRTVTRRSSYLPFAFGGPCGRRGSPATDTLPVAAPHPQGLWDRPQKAVQIKQERLPTPSPGQALCGQDPKPPQSNLTLTPSPEPETRDWAAPGCHVRLPSQGSPVCVCVNHSFYRQGEGRAGAK